MGRSFFLLFFLLISFSLHAGDKGDQTNKHFNKTNTNDHSQYIAINQIFMWVGNNGMGSHDPNTDGNGFYWPGGENATISMLYEDGLVWGAKIDQELRVNGSTYRHGLQAGKILPNGKADDPSLEKYRVYKIRKGWESLPFGPTRDAYEKDYNEWPIEDGAPYVLDKDGNKIPEFVGDEVLWCVSNDMDSSRSRYTYGTLPMGLEQQMTIYGFNKQDDFGDVVFKKYTFLNKGNLTLREMIFAYWSEADVGYVLDDYTGCDTLLKLGYGYNGDNDDDSYGAAPPAIGYVFLQGPTVQGEVTESAKFLSKWRHGYKNLPMTAFTTFINGDPTGQYVDADMGVAAGSIQFYNFMTGKTKMGVQFVDPHTGVPTNTMLAGDPVAGTGWYEGKGWPTATQPNGLWPGNRRLTMSSGSFTMAPGDTQEVVIGIVVGRGTSNLNSITELKRKTKLVQLVYDSDFSFDPVSVKDDSKNFTTTEFSLSQNYSNPFNPNTTISYGIANPGLVSVKIFNILGEEIALLVNEYKNSGSYSVNFDASKLSSGIYFYTMSSVNFVSTKKMIVLK